MAYTLSRNLSLRLDSNLTANARYNLSVLDTLGGTFLVDSTDTLQLRSRGDITIEPESPDLGGSGVGGTITLGNSGHLITLAAFSSQFDVHSPIGLLDQATTGTKYLRLQYKSDASGTVDGAADRTLSLDLEGADRIVALGGNLSTTGGDLALTLIGATSLSLPTSGTLATLSGTETLSNKSISASQNTITGLTNANLSGSAGITYGNLSLSGSLVNTDISGSAAISYSKLNLTGMLVDADVSSTAAIARSKIASGTANHVLINDIAGAPSSEASLALTRGGTGGTSASTGLNNLLPSQSSNSGKVLSTDGSNASWVTAGVGTVRSYSTSWVTADGLTKVVTHNLGSSDILVEIRDESNQIIGVNTITATSTSVATLTASETPTTAWTVVVHA